MERRIAPPKDFEQLLDDLVGPKYNLFESKQKALMYAAAYGRFIDKRLPVERKGTTIRMDIFQNAADDGFVNALAIAVTGDLKVLSEEREDERATIFEEYAHGGLKEIEREIHRGVGEPLTLLLGLTDAPRSLSQEAVPGIDADMLRNLY